MVFRIAKAGPMIIRREDGADERDDADAEATVGA